MLIQGRIAKTTSLEGAVTKNLVEQLFFFISLAIILFLVGLSVTQFLKSQSSINLKEMPLNFTVSNVTDVSFTVSWETEKPLTGYLVYGKDKNTISTKVFDNLATGNMSSYVSKRHAITLTNLEANTEYYFEIISGDKKIESINGEQLKPVRTDSESFLKNPSLGI